MKIRLPRIIHRLYAFFGGYFWSDCSICGRMFGGHEAADTSLMHSRHDGELVCKNCDAEARRRNKQFMATLPYDDYIPSGVILEQTADGFRRIDPDVVQFDGTPEGSSVPWGGLHRAAIDTPPEEE